MQRPWGARWVRVGRLQGLSGRSMWQSQVGICGDCGDMWDIWGDMWGYVGTVAFFPSYVGSQPLGGMGGLEQRRHTRGVYFEKSSGAV